MTNRELEKISNEGARTESIIKMLDEILNLYGQEKFKKLKVRKCGDSNKMIRHALLRQSRLLHYQRMLQVHLNRIPIKEGVSTSLNEIVNVRDKLVSFLTLYAKLAELNFSIVPASEVEAFCRDHYETEKIWWNRVKCIDHAGKFFSRDESILTDGLFFLNMCSAGEMVISLNERYGVGNGES